METPRPHLADHWPHSDDLLIGWLFKAEPFLREPERIDALAKALAPDGWERHGVVSQGTGHASYLVQLRQPDWHTPGWLPGQQLSDHFDIHLELDIPFDFDDGQVPCRLHCETSPYMPRKKLEALGIDTRAFFAFADAFTASLHRRITGTSWRPTRYYLQKAQLPCPLHPTTTIAEFGVFFVPKIEQIRDGVSQAVADARAVTRNT